MTDELYKFLIVFHSDEVLESMKLQNPNLNVHHFHRMKHLILELRAIDDKISRIVGILNFETSTNKKLLESKRKNQLRKSFFLSHMKKFKATNKLYNKSKKILVEKSQQYNKKINKLKLKLPDLDEKFDSYIHDEIKWSIFLYDYLEKYYKKS